MISGNDDFGIRVEGDSTVIQGNYIGTDTFGEKRASSEKSNQGVGIFVLSESNLIGGEVPLVDGIPDYGKGRGNLISGNNLGVAVKGHNNRIFGNAIGTDATGTQSIQNPIGIKVDDVNLKDSKAGPHGIQIGNRPRNPETTRGNLISGGGGGGGIEFAGGGGTIEANRIGTNAKGTEALPLRVGIAVHNTRDLSVGGAAEKGAGNLISGNLDPFFIHLFCGIQFVQLENPENLRIMGNRIGTDASGRRAIGNDLSFCELEPRGGSVTIGPDNQISGNLGDGIPLKRLRASVTRNLIGTTASGKVGLPNGRHGISIGEAASAEITFKTIAFNERDGVHVFFEGDDTELRQNSIFDNGQVGIFRPTKRSPHLQVAVLTQHKEKASVLEIHGSAPPNSIVELFSNLECDSTEFGEGERFLDKVQAEDRGHFRKKIPLTDDALLGEIITATYTIDGNTSRFSRCIPVSHFPAEGGRLDTPGGPLTLSPSPGSQFHSASTGPPVNRPQLPNEVLFAAGLVGFTLEGSLSSSATLLGITGTETFTVTLETETDRPDSYYNYGPTPDDPMPHYYPFLFDGSTGAEIFEDRIVLHYMDGQRGDHDLQVNGQIETLGGPVFLGKSLYLPFNQTATDSFVGVAVSNLSDTSSLLEFERFESDGSQPFEVEPTIRTDLESAHQLAQLTTEILRLDPGTEQANWLQLRSSQTRLGSFFQFGTLDLSKLDGSVTITQPSRTLHFTRAFEGMSAYRGQPATTFLSIANPGGEAMEMELTLHSDDGVMSLAGDSGPTVSRSLPAKGFLYESIGNLFGPGVEISGGWVEGSVTQGGGAVGFELIQLENQSTVIGLNAVSDTGGSESFSAQLASQPGVLFTNVNLINTAEEARSLTLTAFAEDGTQLAQAAFRILNPGDQLSEDAATLFASQPAAAVTGLQGTDANFVGSLQVEADGPGVIGDVIFGDPVGFQFAAALPLQTRSFLEAVFSQVANIPSFFTGLALFAPKEDADITIEVRAADGTLVGESQQFLEAGHRLSKLVPELAPDSDGQAGGYIVLRSTAPLIAQQLFGALGPEGIRLLSAVPPTVLAEPDTGENPVPVLVSLQPASVSAGGSAFTLQVSGSDFIESSEVRWNGEARPTNFLSSSELQAAISSADISAAGSVQVNVFTPSPGGGLSETLSFVIDTPNPVPVLSTMEPASAEAGGPVFTLRVLGSGFVEGSEVRWNGEARVTTVIGSQELMAEISASDIGEAGTAQVTVFNPAPGGGLSDSLPFVIESPANPAPALSSLDPASTEAGGDAFTLRVLGSGFVASSEVRWNGEARSTTFISIQALQAEISAADVSEGGMAQVTVFNPAPGGGLSESLPFSIESPTAPVILDVQAQAKPEESAEVTVELEDPDGDLVKLEFKFSRDGLTLGTREVNSPEDRDLAGFTSGTLTFEFTQLGVDTGFGKLIPNRVDVTATDAEGLVSNSLASTF